MRGNALVSLMYRYFTAVATLALAMGCSKSAPKQSSFPITFVATTDGEPLEGVGLHIGKKTLGSTKDDGLLHVQLMGEEGQSFQLQVECPEGFRGPEKRPIVTLTEFRGLDQQQASRGLEVSIPCSPLKRQAVLVVRAGEPDLPILAQGRVITRTDEAGVAHAVVSTDPHTTFRMAIDTSSMPELRPRNPSMTLTVADSDEIFIVDQAFSVEEKPTKKKRKKRKKRKTKPAEKKVARPIKI